MEEEYRAMETKLKQAALVPEGMGFVAPGMVKPVQGEQSTNPDRSILCTGSTERLALGTHLV
jgi:hypothetical protein